jgi:hypothetical protein
LLVSFHADCLSLRYNIVYEKHSRNTPFAVGLRSNTFPPDDYDPISSLYIIEMSGKSFRLLFVTHLLH